jgi:SpoVK/Ycf46/Vps4 family AAA+-type ATPase
LDDQTLVSLREAFGESPDNRQLLMLLIRAYRDRDTLAEAYPLLAEKAPDFFSDERELAAAAEVCLAAGEPERALAFVVGDTPHQLVQRAQALLELGRMDEARAAYREAVQRNRSVEDPELAALLGSKVREVESAEGRPRLRVISKDETVEAESDLLLVPDVEPVTFEHVGGLDSIKKQIHRKIILPFQKPGLFKKFRKRVGGGILLYGAPGCGKTLLARATAGECGATFFNVAISDVLDMYIGESEQKLHALFEKARSAAPSVLFFDELEALGGKRVYNREATSSKLVSQFLSEMDGFTLSNEGVLILGATNVPWAVDPAFRRPGRFDRVLFVPPPDRAAREKILEILLAGRPVESDIAFGALARLTSGFSGADLHNLVESAADQAIEASIDSGEELPISDEHTRAALKEIRPTTLEWLTTARNYARYANESGQYDEVLSFLEAHGKN